MRRLSVATVVFGVGLTIGLVVPIIAFALFTRATIESDVSAVLRVERVAAARLAAAVVRQRFDGAAAELARFVARPDFRQAASRRDGQALDALLEQFSSLYQFRFLGVVSARGDVVAQTPSGAVDPSFASDVAASVSGLLPESSWAYLPCAGREPFGWGVVGAIVVPLEIGPERIAVYGVLSHLPFTSTLLPTPLAHGRSAMVLNAIAQEVLLMDEHGSIDAAKLEEPGLQRALSIGSETETATIGGASRLVVHATVVSGALELYLLDTPAIALAPARRLTDAVTIGAGLAATMAVVVATVLAVLVSGLRRQRGEIARLAVSEERLRFARDLHDTLGRSFTLIAIKSELATRLLPADSAAADREIKDVQRVAREALRDVRQAVVGYRQPSLAVEIAGARSALEEAGIECHVQPSVDDLPEEIDSLFAWAVREGVTNVIRHSGAARCDIRLSRGDREVQVEVMDDGIGAASETSGQGLQGLKERAIARGGIARAGPLPEKGFSLRVAVPLSPG